mmetsp:Transcript_25591/g.41500  ORF Transcript_25591/g.41500 Transcript_25591/m.41500 type:complete len:278 (-) Transcript_25591:566-1399(-)
MGAREVVVGPTPHEVHQNHSTKGHARGNQEGHGNGAQSRKRNKTKSIQESLPKKCKVLTSTRYWCSKNLEICQIYHLHFLSEHLEDIAEPHIEIHEIRPELIQVARPMHRARHTRLPLTVHFHHVFHITRNFCVSDVSGVSGVKEVASETLRPEEVLGFDKALRCATGLARCGHHLRTDQRLVGAVARSSSHTHGPKGFKKSLHSWDHLLSGQGPIGTCHRATEADARPQVRQHGAVARVGLRVAVGKQQGIHRSIPDVSAQLADLRQSRWRLARED